MWFPISLLTFTFKTTMYLSYVMVTFFILCNGTLDGHPHNPPRLLT
jgi:hypothetical protein